MMVGLHTKSVHPKSAKLSSFVALERIHCHIDDDDDDDDNMCVDVDEALFATITSYKSAAMDTVSRFCCYGRQVKVSAPRQC